MWDRHKVSPTEANEALADTDAVWYEPDPANQIRLTSRVIGYTNSRQQILCLIVLPIDDGYDGINAWQANSTYRRVYQEGQL
jgi:hypothetical protein